MNDTMQQSTQLKLLEIISELETQQQLLKIVLDTCYIGFGGYDLSEAITDLDCIIKRLKRDVLQMDEDDEG